MFCADDFLRNYWQQKPILIKNYFSNFQDPLEAEELAGLALEESIESRLVLNTPEHPYQLSHGPFNEETFLALPESHWTLLVQAVDQVVPEVDALKAAFSFLPSWRMDDVMVSCATPGGGVGPHFDQYDVFLLQGSGRRRWKIGGKCHKDTPLKTDSGLKLLTEFEVEQEFILESGDALYIPPGIAHWGTGEDSGLCYSFGFRAPSHAELLEAFSDELMDRTGEFDRYRDSQLEPATATGEIDSKVLEDSWQAINQALQQKQLFPEAFGKLITQPRYPDQHFSLEPPVQAAQLAALVADGAMIFRHPGSRFAWRRDDSAAGLTVFIDGETFLQPQQNLQAVISLCDVSIEYITEIAAPTNPEQWHNLVLKLVNRGSLLLLQS